MKHIKCRTCGKMVSPKAKRCPKCGTQLRFSLGGLIFLILIIGFLIAIILIALLS
ncbi:zinc-ribbon domain-containing protein [Candidatus Cloacimonadota bacterium]